jgi:rubredoxin
MTSPHRLLGVCAARTGGFGVEKYRCKVCGYIYDPAKGDSKRSIPPGTPFDKLPADWICPVCGAHKGWFVEVL